MYNRADEIIDSDFRNFIKKRYKLNDIEYRSVAQLVIVQRSIENTKKEKASIELERLLNNSNNDLTKKDKFKCHRKITNINRQLNHIQTFGSQPLM